MKNLKKVLSLALAFAMVLGLCIGASAAQDVTTLKDWDEVENKGAATLLNAFEIMQGNTDGTFAPNDNVTRAQAAKMIAVALWGGKDDSTLYKAGNVGGYTDIPSGAWYTGYVNYMTVQGIVAGKGEGKFDPEGNVTGYELLKMCLVALGYDAETEGLVGSGWDLKTMALATKRGTKSLTKDAKVTDWSAPLSRMNAATIIANMIDRKTVSYSDGKVKEGDKFGVEILDMIEKVGTLVANEFGSIGEPETTIGATDTTNAVALLKEKGTEDEPTEAKISVTSTFDDLGLGVKAYFSGETFLYAAIDEATAVAPTLNAANTEYNNFAANAVVYVDGTTVKPAPQADEDESDETDTTASFDKADVKTYNIPANEVKCFDTNGDGKIDVAKVWTLGAPVKVADVVTSEKLGTVILTGSKKWVEKNDTAADKIATLATDGKLINADFTAEKGDYVSIKTLTNAKGAPVNHGYVLETVEGKVTRASAPTDANVCETIYIDGVKYANNVLNNVESVNGVARAVALGAEGTFYLLTDGKTVAVFEGKAGESAPDTYALVFDAGYEQTGSATSIGGGVKTVVEVSAVLEDNTTKTFTVAKIFGNDDTTGHVPSATDFADGGILADVKNAAEADSQDSTKGVESSTNKLMKYKLNDDGTINLYAVADADVSTVDSGTKFTKNVAAANNGTMISSGAVTFIRTSLKIAKSGDDFTITEEKWTANKGLATDTYTLSAAGSALKNAAGEYTYIVAAAWTPDVAPTTGFYYVLSDATQVIGADGSTVNEVEAYYSGDNKVVTLQYKTGTSVKGKIYEDFTTTGGFDNELTNADMGLITKIGDGILRIAQFEETEGVVGEKDGTGKVFTINGETKYFYLDGEDSKKVDVKDLEVSAVEAGKYDTIVVSSGDSAIKTATTVIVLATAKDVPTAAETPSED